MKTITAFHHLHSPQTSAQTADIAPGPYCISAVDGARFALVSGPYPTHSEALALVEAARAATQNHCAWAAFYAFGTVRCQPDCTQPGKLQQWGYDLSLNPQPK